MVKSSPGLEDLWQLHFANAGGQEHNVSNAFLADLNDTGEGNYIKVSAAKTGTLKSKAASWKDLYFPELHNLPGS